MDYTCLVYELDQMWSSVVIYMLGLVYQDISWSLGLDDCPVLCCEMILGCHGDIGLVLVKVNEESFIHSFIHSFILSQPRACDQPLCCGCLC